MGKFIHTYDGLQLHYQTHGNPDGPPVLLIMGLALPGAVWRFVLAELARDHRLITFDNRGAGASDKPAPPYRIAQMADDAAQLIAHLECGPMHVVGVSMGGMIAQELALRYPGRVQSLTLIATHAGGFRAALPPLAGVRLFLRANTAIGTQRRLQAVSELLFPPRYRQEVGQAYLHALLGEDFATPQPRHGLLGQLSAISRHDTRQRLPALKDTPTLVIKPEQDRLVAPENSDLLHRAIPNSKLLSIPEAGHGLIRQVAPKLGDAIRAHIQQNPAPSS